MLRDGCQDTNGFYTFTLLKIISYVKANLNQNENHPDWGGFLNAWWLAHIKPQDVQ
ncbi:MAG: hypothetical protein UR94_C0009G0015 [Parcubacteria group bacterium GW2011_GWA2_36_10]|nr:MAG: hypothetical protein UR94_C0009G0015 [Parcubacteria group bacterium GW2011_GWA2_36_10]